VMRPGGYSVRAAGTSTSLRKVKATWSLLGTAFGLTSLAIIIAIIINANWLVNLNSSQSHAADRINQRHL
jgi:hypothetical protein